MTTPILTKKPSDVFCLDLVHAARMSRMAGPLQGSPSLLSDVVKARQLLDLNTEYLQELLESSQILDGFIIHDISWYRGDDGMPYHVVVLSPYNRFMRFIRRPEDVEPAET